MVKWILQDKNYGLGNFINLTPTISQMEGKVNVYFESYYVKDIYKDWDKINVLNERPENEPLFSSSLINRANTCPDYEYVFNSQLGEYPAGLQTQAPEVKVAVIANGCANPSKRHTKQPPNEVYEYIIAKLHEKGYFTVFVGSVEDFMYSDFAKSCEITQIGNPKLASVWIAKADIVIMNDTGFYHLAGAYQKNGFVLWMNTLLPKNLTPCSTMIMSKNHITDFDKWLKED